MISPTDRFGAMLGGPIAPMLAKMSAPNVAMAFAFTAIWVTDAWFIGRLGILPLASVALVFPVHTMMQMMSAGAMGGGVSSAVARALGKLHEDGVLWQDAEGRHCLKDSRFAARPPAARRSGS